MKPSASVPILLLLISFAAAASPCATEDFETRVSSSTECLLMRRFGPSDPDILVVWLHGNVSSGGPANSHFRLAEKTAMVFSTDRVLAVALVRPGYPDGSGAYSSGSDNGRADNWPRQTVIELGAAIERLKTRFNPKTTVIVGHSGGAAITAVLLGLQPDLAEAAILIACPCDMAAWRRGRSGTPWSSEDPLDWVRQVKSSAQIIALTGSADSTTYPEHARSYVERLQERQVRASLHVVPEMGHIDILRSQAVMDSISRLIN